MAFQCKGELRVSVPERTRPAAPQTAAALSHRVAQWHALLRTIALLNVALWSLAAFAVTRDPAGIHGDAQSACHIQLLLSAAYVFGCAFRSALPVYDIPRIVLVDSRLSSVIVGRSVATFAELCFAVQWALILHRIAILSHNTFAQAASLAIAPLIVIAQVCCWHAVLTTAQRGHVAENSMWGVSAALIVVSLLAIGPQRIVDMYPPMIVWCVLGAAYVVFIFVFDVPMYWSRSIADRAVGRRPLSLTEGVIDACRRRVVSFRWEDWKTEMLWMSLYFTLGVWSSVSIIWASVALGMHRN